MTNKISHVKAHRQVTDFYRNQDVSNFCQCCKILAAGSTACMPDESAEPLALIIRGQVGSWQVVEIDPRSGRVVANFGGRFHEYPCDALRDLARISADTKAPIRVDLFGGDMEWGLLVAKVSDELAERGRWLAERNPSALMVREHPITAQAFEAACSGSLVWDVAEFEAHAEVA